MLIQNNIGSKKVLTANLFMGDLAEVKKVRDNMELTLGEGDERVMGKFEELHLNRTIS